MTVLDMQASPAPMTHPRFLHKRNLGPDARIEAVWAVLADRRFRLRAPKVTYPAAWKAKVRANARREHMDEALGLLERFPDLTVDELAACLDGETGCLRYARRAE